MMFGLLVALLATVFLHGNAGRFSRMGLIAGYVGLAMLTYE